MQYRIFIRIGILAIKDKGIVEGGRGFSLYLFPIQIISQGFSNPMFLLHFIVKETTHILRGRPEGSIYPFFPFYVFRTDKVIQLGFGNIFRIGTLGQGCRYDTLHYEE